MSWIIMAIGLFVSSPIMYLFIRKAKDLKKDINVQNLSIFLIPTLVYFLYNICTKTSMIVEVKYFIIIFLSAIFLSVLGNTASLKAVQLTSNPGYSLMIQKSYAIFTTIMSVLLFGSAISIKDIVAIIIVLSFTSLILIEKSSKKNTNKIWILYTFGAFFAFGALSLVTTHLVKQGLSSTVINFYICLIVSLSFMFQIFRNKVKLSFDKQSIAIFIGAGIPASFFHFCMIQGYLLAPNPGFISAVNVSSIAFLTILYRVVFKDALTIKKSVGILGILAGLILLFI